jgi:hypothetical protein
MGVMGTQGSVGPQGPQGTQGLVGPQGPCCPVTSSYVNVYSLMNQLLPSGASPVMEMVVATTTAFDISMAPISGQITVLKKGVYQLLWSVDAVVTPPLPAPVPAMAFGISVNGTIVPSTTGANFAISPDDVCTHTTVSSLVVLNVGDVLQLVNTSTNSVNLISTLPATSSIIPVVSAQIDITLVQAL